MNTQNYAVNIRVGLANPARVNISQGDTGRTLAFSLYDGLSPFTPPTGSTVTIVGRKPSKLGFSEACTVSGNVATVATTLAMTQEAGKFPAELRIEAGGQSIGTANFTMYVEPSPHPDGTTDGTHATVDNLQTQIGDLSNLETTAKTDLVSAINEAAQSGGVVIDDTLTQTGQAADAKKTGDEISAIKADLGDLDDLDTTNKSSIVAAINEAAQSDGGGWTEYQQNLLITILREGLYSSDQSSNIDALEDSFEVQYTNITLNTNSISLASIGSTSQLTATTTPRGGTVTWSSSNPSVATVDNSGLVTSTGYGTATITASIGGLTATCSVTIAQATLVSISAVYTQSGTVYNTTPLDDLKADLVVTATWDNSTTSTVPSADYTLSGTLTEGTSTITVSYGGKTATFNVTVTEVRVVTLHASTEYADDPVFSFEVALRNITAYSDDGVTDVTSSITSGTSAVYQTDAVTNDTVMSVTFINTVNSARKFYMGSYDSTNKVIRNLVEIIDRTGASSIGTFTGNVSVKAGQRLIFMNLYNHNPYTDSSYSITATYEE